MDFSILDFIDSPDIRKFNEGTYFTPAQQAVLVSRSHEKTIEEKIMAIEHLLESYPPEAFENGEVFGQYPGSKEMPFYETVRSTLGLWKGMLEDRTVNEGVIYAEELKEKEDITERRFDLQFYTDYEKAFSGMKKEKQFYLDEDDLKDVPTMGVIYRIPVDNGITWSMDCDMYYFDNELRLIHVAGQTYRYQIGEEEFEPLWTYQFYLPVPFKPGDLVKSDAFNQESLYGVIYEEYDSPIARVDPHLYCWVDIYDTWRDIYDFTDDTDMLTLSYCDIGEVPEKIRKKLDILSKVRKGKEDVYSLIKEIQEK